MRTQRVGAAVTMLRRADQPRVSRERLRLLHPQEELVRHAQRKTGRRLHVAVKGGIKADRAGRQHARRYGDDHAIGVDGALVGLHTDRPAAAVDRCDAAADAHRQIGAERGDQRAVAAFDAPVLVRVFVTIKVEHRHTVERRPVVVGRDGVDEAVVASLRVEQFGGRTIDAGSLRHFSGVVETLPEGRPAPRRTPPVRCNQIHVGVCRLRQGGSRLSSVKPKSRAIPARTLRSAECSHSQPRSSGYDVPHVSVWARPPSRSRASITRQEKPRAIAPRAAAMPAAPAPTTTTSGRKE